MAFEPRSREQLARLVLGSILARSPLSDASPGSVINLIAKSIGAVLASTERRIEQVREAFDFRRASGEELDERIAELPLSTITRHEAAPASGSVRLTFSAPLAADLVIPAGSSVSRSLEPSILYSTSEDTTIAAGSADALITVTASAAGTIGNCAAGTINTIDQMPILVSAVTNPSDFTNGQAEETDRELRQRGLLYLQSLARCQAQAIEYAALSYSLTDGRRLLLAQLFEDPEIRGYSELLIDDGSGSLGDARSAGARYSGTDPTVRRIYHDAPAVAPVVVRYTLGGVTQPVDPDRYLSIPERGVIYLDPGAMPAGATWQLDPYQVYTGAIAAIQSEIEGTTTDPTAPGWRAAGTRIRVLAPDLRIVDLDVSIIPEDGIDLVVARTAIREAINELLLISGPGVTIYRSALIEAIMGVDLVRSVELYRSGTGAAPAPVPFADVHLGERELARLGLLTVVPTPEVT